MWPNPQETADLVAFIEKILNGSLYFLCSEYSSNTIKNNTTLFTLKNILDVQFSLLWNILLKYIYIYINVCR